MIDPNHVPPVAHDEMLARFILHGNEFRKLDGSLKAELFMPYKIVTLSVKRHSDSTEE